MKIVHTYTKNDIVYSITKTDKFLYAYICGFGYICAE